MSLITCKVCGAPITKIDARLTRCDKPECRKRNVRRVQFGCIICGNEIPLGSKRNKYCGKECEREGKRRVRILWDKKREMEE